MADLNSISLFVLYTLVFMSVLSWYLIFTKTLQLWETRRRCARFAKFFRNEPGLESVIKYLALKRSRDPFSNLARQGINAATHHIRHAPERPGIICTHAEFVTRNMHQAIREDSAHLNSGLAILASIASTAPFIGLLGTVLGIYDALKSISARGQASLDTVAGPVGEALIMTAAGLAVAIPAVLAYNALIRGNRAFLAKLDAFAHELFAILNTGSRIEPGISDKCRQ
ncbi:MAG: MotA/TolQ/ExbB proton channel family protein [Gammaproteobacteria bacterium]|nr:MotA/TolQ/ExbB proton channel family protein [Gammaproteobacteria bacterium]